MSFFKSITWLFAIIVLTCTAFAEPNNISLLKKELITYHDSGAYLKEYTQVITKARNYLLEEAAANSKQKNKKKLAIVLDIDETSLSNYQNIAAQDFATNKEQLHKYINQATAPAIKQTLALYNLAIKHGVYVFFVTGRSESFMQATKDNLHLAGYQHWSGLYLRSNNYKNSSIIPFKSQARAAITKRGFTIIESIGDQVSDLEGGYTKKKFKLPNPFYYLP